MRRVLFFISICTVLTVNNLNAQYLPIDSLNGWELAWQDEFEYSNETLDVEWESQNGPSNHILCSRWRDNAVVIDGVLELQARKENRGGQEWTAGSIWTKKKFKYGYFECRYKYAGANATNNSFWLMTRGPAPSEGEKFEIDINEGHFPNEVNTNIHNWGAEHSSDSKSISFGIEPGVSIPLEIPVTTKKIRFSSNNKAHFHIREFRIYNDNSRNFPNVMSETADKDIAGLINHARAVDTKLTVSGILRDEFQKHRMVDGKVMATSWVSQKIGEKWIEFEWDEDKTIGCIQFINGWPSGNDWNALISDYKIEYWDGAEWITMASLNLTTDDTFADVYHTYGLLWNKEEIVFYFDGKEIRREKNRFCYSEVPIWLSLAIIAWDGEVTDAIDGTSMKVDYVRYYKKLETTGLNGLNDKEINTYPNPVEDKLNFQNLKEDTLVSIFNMQGQKILESTLSSTQSINVSQLHAGVYCYVLENRDDQIKGKFVKN